MKKMSITTGALVLASLAVLLGGCGDSGANGTGARLVYKMDQLNPSALDTSKQTMEQPPVAQDPDQEKYLQMYNAKQEAEKKAKPAAAPRPAVAKAEPQLAAPLASKEDIDAAKKRVADLRGTVKTAKNGAITSIVVESADTTLDDMKLFGRLADLESFSFLGNVFNDEYLAQMKDLKKVSTISVQNSDISRATLEMFATYPELVSLDIRRDLKLENKDLEVIAGMPKLEKLFAYYNSFTSSGANKISKSATLKVVDLRGCQDISDPAAKYLARMATLEEVYFRFGITNDGVKNLAAAPALKFVEFQDCGIDSSCGATFAEYPALTGLRVFRCKSFGDDGVNALANLKLERLELRDLNVSNAGVLPLAAMTSLRKVELSEIAIDADALNQLSAAWKDLTDLYLFAVPVTDDVVKTIAANMKGLKSLTLRAAVGKLTDASLNEIVKMDSLETLDLRENADFSLDGMMQLAKMKNLRKIYVKGTALGDSGDAAKAKAAEFKKINPKCAISN